MNYPWFRLSVRYALVFIATSAACFAAVASSIPPAVESSERPVIRSVAAAAERWPHLTSDDEPVHLEGVVTSTMPSGAFRLHDGRLGIYVTKSASGQRLTAGDRVSVQGVLRQQGFSPWIAPRVIVPLGRGEFPEPRRGTYSLLASGAADNQWLEIEGVVRAAEVLENFVVLELGMEGGNLRVWVDGNAPRPPLDSLVDAEVRLRGVAAVNVNRHGHVVEPSFRVPSFAEVEVTRAAPPDAFAQPVVPVRQLMKVSAGARHPQRVRTQGTVTRQLSAKTFFLRQGQEGLKVATSAAVDFAPGTLVDVIGFPQMWEGMAVLEQSACRVLGPGDRPAANVVPLAALLDGSHNSDLVRVRARLVDFVTAGQKVTLILQADDQIFKGVLNLSTAGAPALPEKNSLVEVTGICAISELEDVWFYQPRSLLLLVASVDDLAVLEAPPWWTPQRLWRALATVCCGLLGATGWLWALRRQVEQTRAVIEQQARHAAALEERSRIARELHDTLEQGLTGLSLQMKAMETDLAHAPHPVSARLQFARQMLRQSRALARNAIRELRSEAVPERLEGFLAGLHRVVNSWNHSGALAVEMHVAGVASALPARVERHLLGIGTEAMTNAVKHGRAQAIRVDVRFGQADVTLHVRDNGVGFDPAQQLEQASGCFGLLGMRERAREIGGDLRIESRVDGGAEVVVTVPLTLPSETSVHPSGLPPASPVLANATPVA